mgnify:FL=1
MLVAGIENKTRLELDQELQEKLKQLDHYFSMLDEIAGSLSEAPDLQEHFWRQVDESRPMISRRQLKIKEALMLMEVVK